MELLERGGKDEVTEAGVDRAVRCRKEEGSNTSVWRIPSFPFCPCVVVLVLCGVFCVRASFFVLWLCVHAHPLFPPSPLPCTHTHIERLPYTTTVFV